MMTNVSAAVLLRLKEIQGQRSMPTLTQVTPRVTQWAKYDWELISVKG